MVIPIVYGGLWIASKNLGKRMSEVGKNQDHPNHSTVKISKDTAKSPVDVSCLVNVRETHHFELVWKTHKK